MPWTKTYTKGKYKDYDKHKDFYLQNVIKNRKHYVKMDVSKLKKKWK